MKRSGKWAKAKAKSERTDEEGEQSVEAKAAGHSAIGPEDPGQFDVRLSGLHEQSLLCDGDCVDGNTRGNH